MRCPLNEKHEYSVQHRMLVISSEDLIRWNTSEKTDEINNSCLTRSAGGALCCCSVTQLCPTLCDPVDYSTPGFPVLQYLPELAQTHVIESVMPSNHLILCCPLLLLPSIFPSIRVFSSESALHIKWPNYWSFSFSISPPREYSGLISFRVDWFDLLAV